MEAEEKRRRNTEACRRYRAKHLDRVRKRQAEMYHLNRDKRLRQAAASRENTKARTNAERAARRERDPEYAERFRKARRAHRARNLVSERARVAAKYRTGSPQYRLKHNSLSALRKSLKNKGGKRWHEIVGYTSEQLKEHLERQFTKGMTWENYGEWQVDHIVPVASFKYETAEDAEFKACWALTNLRPLWRSENNRKSWRRTHLL